MSSPEVDSLTETACVVATLRVAVTVENSVPPSVISVPSTDSVTSGKMSLSLIVIGISELNEIFPLYTVSMESFKLSSFSPNILSSEANKNTLFEVSPAGIIICLLGTELSIFNELFSPSCSHLQPPLGSEYSELFLSW